MSLILLWRRLLLPALLVALWARPCPADAAGQFTIIRPAGFNAELEELINETARGCLPLLARQMETQLSRDVVIRLVVRESEFLRYASPLANATVDGHTVLVNQQRILARTEPYSDERRLDVISILCHELTHVFQNELQTDRGARHGGRALAWISEGQATYMEGVALEHLVFVSLSTTRTYRLRRLKEARGTGLRLPRLEHLQTVAQFTKAARETPVVPTYAMVAVELLQNLTSPRALREYFSALGRADSASDRQDLFRRAFGITVAQFQAALDRHLLAVLR